ncbi:hypothetical protein BRYFOR_08577 [Marvinbryantia formatexigens DSM 14469]|uniref:Uncharacterized protein n=2 Tax=Marvinbryantia TaxID=248744 RepID=C6LIU7_9FIRM|nr:hypothetical protein BRYFOR_08577 [Marvinbryantia formatexigens DSM 14469]
MKKKTFLQEEKYMDKKLNLEDYRKELGKRQLKEKIYSAVESGKNWAVQNKEEAITLAAGVCGCATAIIKTVGKRVNSQKEKELKDLYCYDRSLGHYWRLRRELTNREWVEIDQRKQNGERLADILASMKVLK